MKSTATMLAASATFAVSLFAATTNAQTVYTGVVQVLYDSPEPECAEAGCPVEPAEYYVE